MITNRAGVSYKVSVIIPTRNAGNGFSDFIDALQMQSLKPDVILVIDSKSTDGTFELACKAGFNVIRIDPIEFDHGGTRKLGVKVLNDSDFVVFLTQDAVIADKFGLERLVTPLLDDDSIAAAYGRQLPRIGAGPVESHARFFNYPPKSCEKSIALAPKLGLKTAFFSNSFSVFRVKVLDSIGNFPVGVIFGEDMIAAAKILSAGWKIAYIAEAKVFHSHSLSLSEEFHRSFDNGCLHRFEPWLRKTFGKAEGEGFRFVYSEWLFLRPYGFSIKLEALLHDVVKYLAFRLGCWSHLLPGFILPMLSGNKSFWKKIQKHRKQ